MFQAWFRSLARRFGSHLQPVRRSSKSKRSPRKPDLRLEPLEERLALTLQAPPIHLLPVGATPLAVALPRLDFDARADFAALGTDGSLTVALNGGNNTWSATSVTPLGVTDPAGFAFGLVDQDLFLDVAVQTSTGLLTGRGDGGGRFTNFTFLTLDPAGSLAAPAGGRVEPSITFLADGDQVSDVVTVAPGADQVIVLRGVGGGRFADPVRLASGGDQPVAVVVGQLIGDAVPDLAVGHRDGTVTFFAGNPGGTFTARPELTVTGLGAVTGVAIADVDGNGELDLAVSGTDRVTVLRNATDPAPEPVIANGDFSAGLTAWTQTSGTVSTGGGFAEFREDSAALLSTIRQSFVVPPGARKLVFDLVAYGLEDPAGGLPDAFEASLLGPDNQPLVAPFRSDASAFFAVNPGNTVGLGAGATFDGRRVTVDLSAVPAGTAATLVFHLAGNPAGSSSVAGVDNVSLDPAIGVDERFFATALQGPFDGALGVAVADVDGDGDGTPDVVVADTSRLLVFNGDGGFVRNEVPLPPGGTGAVAVAVAPLTAGDAVADVAVALAGSNNAATPLVSPVATLAAAPRLAPLTPLTGAEGAAVTLNATFTDPDGGGPYTALVDWGDGSAPAAATVTFEGNSGTITATHTYADNGSYPVRVHVLSANDGPIDFRDTTATVGNVAPSVIPISILTDVNSDVEFALATFTDPGFTRADFRTRETFLATIDWGDNTPDPFGRLQVVNGTAGTPTAGTVFGSHRYAAVGTYTGFVTVRDDDGGTTQRPFTVTVRSVPVFESATDLVGVEGQTVAFQATFTDPTPYDAHTALIEWGDGTSSAGVLGTSGGVKTVTGSHTYADNGNFTVRVTVTDRAGHAVTRTAAATVTNVAPTLSPAADQNVRVDRSLSLTLGTFSDPGFTFDPDGAGPLAGTAETFTATVNWGDGSAEAVDLLVSPGSPGSLTTGVLSKTHAYHSLGTFTVTLTVRDDDGGEAVKTFSVIVSASAPSITSTAVGSGLEGSGVTLTGTFDDPQFEGPYTAVVDWGDGTTSPGAIGTGGGVGLVTATHTYADNGVYPVTLRLINRFGLSATETTTAAVGNVVPAVVPPSDQQVGVNRSVTLDLGAFSDPGFTFDPDRAGPLAGTAETFTATVNWGDGSTPETVPPTVTPGGVGVPTTGTVAAAHTYTVPGTFTVTVTVTDDDAGVNTRTFTVTVVAAAPVVGNTLVASGAEGALLTLTATLTDADPGDDHTVVIEWGDGTSGPGQVTYDAAGVGTVTASHTYADNGLYPVVVRASDRYGLTASDTKTVTVGNAPPTLTPATNRTTLSGESVSLTAATFSDPGFTFDPDGAGPLAGTQETFTATIDWGDGTSNPVVPGVTPGAAGVLTTGSVPGTHTYANAGTYTVTVTVADDDGGTATGSFTITVNPSGPKFFVPDQSRHATYRYGDDGAALGSHAHAHGNSRPRGIAANAAGTTLWVVDAKKEVFVYTAAGLLLGNWAAGGLNQPQDIATDGTHVWIVDDSKGRVQFYANAAGRRSGSQEPASGFNLDSANKNPSGLVVRDGKLWVTDDRPSSQNDRVFVYTTGGQLLGSWELDPANKDSAGITLDPSGGTDLWVVDRQDSRVYHYAGGTAWVSGAHAQTGWFALAAANHHAEGVADPAPAGWADYATPASAHPAPTGIDFPSLIDVTPLAQVEYRTTYYNWAAGELRAEARLTNLSAPRLTGPVLAVFDTITPPVTLDSRDGLTPAGKEYVGFGTTELTADGLLPGESSSYVGLRFAATPDVRFEFDVTLLAPANRAPAFTSTPVVKAIQDQAYNYTAVATDPDGDPLTYSLVTGPAGMTVDPVTGAVSWMPTAGDLGTHAVVIRASDGRGGTVDQPFALTVFTPLPANNAPVIVSAPDTTFSLGSGGSTTGPTSITLNAVVRDFNSTHPDFESGISGHVTGLVASTLGADGNPVYIGTNDRGAIQSPATFNQWWNDVPGVNLTTVLPLTLNETAAGSGIYRFNSGSFFPIDGQLFGNQGRSHNYHFTLRMETTFTYRGGEVFTFTGDDDVWVFINNRLAVDLGGVHGTIGGSVNLNNAAAALGLTVGQSYSFVLFFAERHTSGSNFNVDTSIDLQANRQYRYPVRAVDADGDTLTYSLEQNPTGMQINPTTGLITWTPETNQAGTHTVRVRVEDGRGGVDIQEYVLTVSPPGPNVPPSFTSAPRTRVFPGDTYTYQATATDPNDDPLTFNLLTGPAGLQINRLTGLLTWATTAANAGNHPVTIQVTDGRGGTATQSYTLRVTTDPNQPPSFTSDPAILGIVGQEYEYTPTATDPDGDPLVFSIVNGPAGMAIDPLTGRVVWTPSPFHTGTVPVTLRVADGAGGSAIQSYNIVIVGTAPANNPPVIVSDPPTTTYANGQPFSYTVVAVDPDRDPITYGLAAGPSGMTINPTTGAVTWPSATGGLDQWASSVLGFSNQVTPDGWGSALRALGAPDATSYGDNGNVAWSSPVRNGAPEYLSLGYATPVRATGVTVRESYGNGFVTRIDLIDTTGVAHTIWTGQDPTLPLQVGELTVTFPPTPYLVSGVTIHVDTSRDQSAWEQIDAVRLYGATSVPVSVTASDGRGGTTQQDFNVLVSNAPTSSITGGVYHDLNTNGVWDRVRDDDPNNRLHYYDTVRNTDVVSAGYSGMRDTGTGSITLAGVSGTVTRALIYWAGTAATMNPADGATVRFNGTTVTGTALGLGGFIWNPHSFSRSYRADVTTLVSGNGAYTLADFVNANFNIDGGVSLVVFYSDADSTNNRDVVVFDGFDLNVGSSLDPIGWDSTLAGLGAPSSAVLQLHVGDGQNWHDADIKVNDRVLAAGPQIFTGNSLPRGPWGFGPGNPSDGGLWDIKSFDLTASDFVNGSLRITSPYLASDQDYLSLVAGLVIVPAGQLAQSEPGLGGRTVYVDQNTNGRPDPGEPTAVTAADGSFTITGLAPGTYQVREVLPGGWSMTAPTAGYFAVTVGGETRTEGGVEFGNFLGNAGPNRPPAFSGADDTTARVGQLYEHQPTAADPDNDPLTFSLLTRPTGMAIDPSTGRLFWVPTAGQLGPQQVTILVSDGRGGTDTRSFTINVSAPAAGGLVISSVPPRLATVGVEYTYSPEATDTDGNPVNATFTLINPQTGMEIDAGEITWTPAEEHIGLRRVTVKATANGLTGYQSYEISVRPVNTPPIVTPPSDRETVAGRPYRAVATATDTADTFRFSLALGAPAGLAIDPVTGVLYWATEPDDVNSYPVTIRATDERGAVGEASFTLIIRPDVTAPDVAVVPDQTTVDPDTPVTVTVTTADDVGVVEVTLTANGTPVPLTLGVGTFTPTEPGIYELVATATDAAGNTSTATVRLKVTDPDDVTAPVITITSPLSGALITYLTDLVGTITDDNLDTFRVDLALLGTNQWTTIGGGTAANAVGTLAVIDPTLRENDAYVARVTAIDINGLSATAEVELFFGGQAKVGNYSTGATDVTIPVAGGPDITFARSYDTLHAGVGGSLGFGWQICALEPRIRETVPVNLPGEKLLGMFSAIPFKEGDKVYLTTPDCKRVGFTFRPVPTEGIFSILNPTFGTIYEPRWVPDPGVEEELWGEFDRVTINDNFTGSFDRDNGYRLPILRLPDGSFVLAYLGVQYNPLGYQLIQKDGTRWHYNQFSGLQDVTDRNGNTITVTGNGLSSTSGQQLGIQRDAQGRITKITDPEGKSTTYTYNAQGELEAVHGPDGRLKSHYEYEGPSPHFISEVNGVRESCGCTPTESEPVRLEYNLANQLVKTINALGLTTGFTYDLQGNTERVTDPEGHTTLIEYDDRGNVVRTVSPNNDVARFTFDANDNMTSVTDERGFTTEMTYDGRGNMTSVKDALGFVTQMTYNARNDVTSQTDALGNTYQYVYDARGRLITTRVPLGGEMHMTYDAQGRPVTTTDFNGNVTVMEYGNSKHPTRITHADGSSRQMTYNSSGQLTSTTDENGNRTEMFYDAQGLLLEVREPLGRVTRFTYVGQDIRSITNPGGQITYFEHDLAGRMTAIIDPLGGRTSFSYDGNGQRLTETDPLGRTTRYVYRPDRRLESVTDPVGAVTRYEYDPVGNVSAEIDALGNRTSVTRDARNYVVGTTDQLGNTWSYTYDAVGNRTSVTDANGKTTRVEYDALQRVAQVIDPLGGITRYTHDAQGNVVRVVEPHGHAVQYIYDSRNLPVQRINPEGGVERLSYDAVGNRTAVTDELGRTTAYQYDALNRETARTDANGGVWLSAYNASNQLVSATDPLGNQTLYGYDALDRLVSVTQAPACGCGGGTWTVGYDAVGNLTRAVDPLGRVNELTYDDGDRMTSWKEPNGAVTTYTYDALGQRLGSTDALGRRTRTVYDAAGRVLEQTWGINSPGATTRYQYDGVGNVTAVTDPLGRTTTVVYDGLNRPIREVDAAGGVSQFTYDAAGNLLSETDPLNRSYLYTYDDHDRLATVTDPLGGVTRYTYDAVGNLLSETDPLGRTSSSTYDNLNQVVTETDALGGVTRYVYNAVGLTVAVTDPLGRTTFTSHDRLLRENRVIDPLGGVTEYTYDAAGNPLTVTDPLGRTTTSTYDNMGRLSTTTDPLGGVTRYEYDLVGNLLRTTDPLGRTTSFTYDSFDRVVTETDALGGVTRYTYDDVGNVLSVTDALGRTSYATYDLLDRVSTETDALGGVTRHTYDAVGNELSFTDALGRTTLFGYDALDRMTTQTDALGGVTQLQFDAVGNLLQQTDPLGRTTRFSYDALDRMLSQTDALGGVTRFGYDAVGNQLSVVDALGRTTSSTYDALDRLLTETDAAGGLTRYGYDAVGNLLSETDPLGRVSSSTYDGLNRPLTVTDALGGVTRFGYDAVGNQLSVVDALGRTTSSTYDALDRLLTETDAAGAVTRYDYDAVGRLLRVTDPVLNVTQYRYDDLDRLVQTTDPLGRSSFYTYDAVGNTTGVTDRNGRVRTFAYDALDRRTAETWWEGGTAVNTMALSYDAVGNILSAADNNSRYAFTHDALDRRVTEDNVGTPGLPRVVLTHGYDAVGNRTSVTDNQGVSVASTYDARNLLANRTWHLGTGINPAVVDYQYDAAWQRTRMDRREQPVGPVLVVGTEFGYDAVGRLTGLRHGVSGSSTPLADYQYTHDLAGQLLSETHHGQTSTYTLDAAGQLTGADHTGQADEGYAYDANGNRTGTGHVVGANNQILSDGAFNYAYDAEGNLVRRTVIATGEYTTYEFDHRNRLVRGTEYSAGGIILREESLTYDVFDRLIARTVDDDGAGPAAAETLFTVYDGDHAWADYDAAGNVQARYLFGDGTDEILARFRPDDGVDWYLTDRLGTVRDLVDAHGQLLNHIDYDTFGNIVAQTDPSAGDRFTFTGREWDPVLGLYYYRARFYDPQLGRFLSEDSWGFGAGDANLYRYLRNNPLAGTDPSGHMAITEWAILQAKGALLDIGCRYAEAWARGETVNPWEDLQSLWGQFDPNALLDQLLRDPEGAIGDLVNRGGLAGLDLDPAALMEEFGNDPGGLMEQLIGFNPVAFVDELEEDPWAALESLTRTVAEATAGTSFGSSLAFNFILKAVTISQLTLPALSGIDKAPEIFALLDTYMTGGFDNWKSFFVNYLCGGVNMQMVPLAAGAAIAGKNDPLLQGLNSFDLFMQVGGLFQLRKGMHIQSASSSGSRFRGKVGCRLCPLEGRAPNAGSVARALMAGASILRDGLGGLTTGDEHCFAPGVQVHLASGETRNIEAVGVGDVVLAWDPATGEVSGKPVVRLFRNTSDHYRVLQLHAADGRPQEIRTTDGHPFRVAGKGWVLAEDLRPGDRLVQADGSHATLAASRHEAHPEGVPIYNFEVEGWHTYYVSERAGKAALLVHNKSNRPRGRRSNRRSARSCTQNDPCKYLLPKTGIRKIVLSTPVTRFMPLTDPQATVFYRGEIWRNSYDPVNNPLPTTGPTLTFRRVSSVTALLPLGRRGTAADNKATAVVRFFGGNTLRNDDAGHIVGNQFGGAGVWARSNGNIFPQHPPTNQYGKYRQLERSIESSVVRKRVCITVTLRYRSGQNRPYEGSYRRWVDGREVRKPSAKFDNPLM